MDNNGGNMYCPLGKKECVESKRQGGFGGGRTGNKYCGYTGEWIDIMQQRMSDCPMTEGLESDPLGYAEQIAENNFDRWNEVSGCFPLHVSYWYEIKSCIEDAVKIGFMAAKGIAVEFSKDGDLIDKVSKKEQGE